MLPKELGHLEKDEKRKTEINSKKYLSHLPKPKEVFFWLDNKFISVN